MITKFYLPQVLCFFMEQSLYDFVNYVENNTKIVIGNRIERKLDFKSWTEDYSDYFACSLEYHIAPKGKNLYSVEKLNKFFLDFLDKGGYSLHDFAYQSDNPLSHVFHQGQTPYFIFPTFRTRESLGQIETKKISNSMAVLSGEGENLLHKLKFNFNKPFLGQIKQGNRLTQTRFDLAFTMILYPNLKYINALKEKKFKRGVYENRSISLEYFTKFILNSKKSKLKK